MCRRFAFRCHARARFGNLRFVLRGTVALLRTRLAAALPSPPGLRRLNLVNAHTGESFAGPYRNDDGPIAGGESSRTTAHPAARTGAPSPRAVVPSNMP